MKDLFESLGEMLKSKGVMTDKKKLEMDKRAFFGCYNHVRPLYDSNKGWNIELRSIDSLTDEEAIDYFNILWARLNQKRSMDFKIEYGRGWSKNLISDRFGFTPSKLLNGIDYLRSIGILIPFREYTVEQILENGWAVIKE